MRSASSRATRSRMSRLTSAMSRSAPRPERSTASACSLLSAWVTDAPLSIAILLAMVSWPPSVPTIRSRMAVFLQRSFARSGQRPEPCLVFGLDDFGHGHAQLVFDQHHFAAGNQAVVDVDVDGFADLAVELEHGARSELEQVADRHAGAAEHRRYPDRDVEQRLQVGGAAGDGFIARGERAGVVDGRRLTAG